MTGRHLEIFVEEPSMQTFLEVLLPRMLDLSSTTFTVNAFTSKQDLLSKLPSRLRGYSRWLPAAYRLVVLVDRDRDDCHELKRRLETMAADAGLKTLSQARERGEYPQLVPRIVIEELEAWYFGDWDAVKAAYPKMKKTPKQCRSPDAIVDTWETFERILQKRGYFKTGLRKIEAARTIASRVEPDRNVSKSFQVFRSALRKLSVPEA